MRTCPFVPSLLLCSLALHSLPARAEDAPEERYAFRRGYLTPDDDKAHLRVEADRGEQRVGLSHGDGAYSAPALCRTPCDLYVYPGLYAVTTDAPGIVTNIGQVKVTPSGLKVTMRALSQERVRGSALLFDVGAAAILGPLLVELALQAVSAKLGGAVTSLSGPPSSGGGSGAVILGKVPVLAIMGAGAAVAVTGGVLWLTSRPGVKARTLLRSKADGLALGPVPTRRGALLAATARF